MQLAGLEPALQACREGIGRLAPNQSLFALYQACGELLAQAGRVDEAVALLREGIGRIPFQKYNRNNVVQLAMRLCLAIQDRSGLNSLITGTGVESLDPTEIMLGRVLQYYLDRDWRQMAQVAHEASVSFSAYLPFLHYEMFSWFCCGDTVAANQALQNSVLRTYNRKFRPTGWLEAFIALHLGDQQIAEAALTGYLGRPLRNDELSLEFILQEWNTILVPGKIRPASYYPILPTQVTSFVHEVTCLPWESPVLLRHQHDQTTAVDSASNQAQSDTIATSVLSSSSQLVEMEYTIETQPWYAAAFPLVEEIEQEQIETLKSSIDVVIMTATDVELQAVAHLLDFYPTSKSVLLTYVGPETYYLGKFGEYTAAVTKCRMGAIGEGSVILATEQAQRFWQPKAIIMVGIAFGKDSDKQKIGDVLVASQVISYEPQRIGAADEYRGPIPPSDTTLLNRFENAPTWNFLRPDGKRSVVIVGPILSGEKLVLQRENL